MIAYVFAVLGAIPVAAYLHEGSHWFVGWIGKTQPNVEYVFWVFPNGVHHGKIDSMDAAIIRISGLAPFLWMPVAFFAAMVLFVDQSPRFLFPASVALFTILMSTESDAIAFRDPEKYRESCVNGELSRKPLFFPNPPEWVPRF